MRNEIFVYLEIYSVYLEIYSVYLEIYDYGVLVHGFRFPDDWIQGDNLKVEFQNSSSLVNCKYILRLVHTIWNPVHLDRIGQISTYW